MITPIHILFNLLIYFILGKTLILTTNIDLILLLCSELIDLDHLRAKPIYHPRRNSFKTHPLHKQWKIILIISLLLLFYRPLMFLGIGLISHFLLDFIENKIKKI